MRSSGSSALARDRDEPGACHLVGLRGDRSLDWARLRERRLRERPRSWDGDFIEPPAKAVRPISCVTTSFSAATWAMIWADVGGGPDNGSRRESMTAEVGPRVATPELKAETETDEAK